MGNGSEVSIIIAFAAGVLSFLSPCVLPLFPSYITYITGKSFEDIKSSAASLNIRKVTAVHSLLFIAGFSAVFVVLGVTFVYLGSFFGIRRMWLERIGGILIIVLGLHIAGVLNLKFLNLGKKVTVDNRKISYLSSFLIGMAFAVGWSPCVGPVLSSILIYASTLQEIPKAVVLLLAYSLGLGVPFFVASLAVNQFLFLFNRFKAVMRFIPVITGLFLIFIGVFLFLGKFSELSAIVMR